MRAETQSWELEMHPLTGLECWSLGPSLQATARSSSCVIFGLSSSCRCSALHTTQEPSHVQSVVSCEDFCFFGTRNHPAIGLLALQARRALSKDDKRVIRTSARIINLGRNCNACIFCPIEMFVCFSWLREPCTLHEAATMLHNA